MKLDFRHGAYSTMSQRFVAGFDSLNDAKIFAAKLFIPDIKENEIVIVRTKKSNRIKKKEETTICSSRPSTSSVRP